MKIEGEPRCVRHALSQRGDPSDLSLREPHWNGGGTTSMWLIEL